MYTYNRYNFVSYKCYNNHKIREKRTKIKEISYQRGVIIQSWLLSKYLPSFADNNRDKKNNINYRRRVITHYYHKIVLLLNEFICIKIKMK